MDSGGGALTWSRRLGHLSLKQDMLSVTIILSQSILRLCDYIGSRFKSNEASLGGD